MSHEALSSRGCRELHIDGAGSGCGGQPPTVLQAPPVGGPGPGPGDPPRDDEQRDDGKLDAVQRSLLRHRVRRWVFELVARTPGLNKHQIATRVGIGHKLANHHLERLEVYGLIDLREGPREGEVVCFHVDDAWLWERKTTRILFGRAPCRRVALYVWSNPGCTTGDLRQALDKRPRTVQEHLSTLRDWQLVERVWLDRRTEYHPTDRLETWAQAVGHRYPDPEDDAHR